MLTIFSLRFLDASANAKYERDRNGFYNKVLPVVAFGLACLLVTVEVVYRSTNVGRLSYKTSIINAVALAYFLALFLLNKRNRIVASWLVCPGLTAFVFYYVDFVDYDQSDLSMLYKMVLGITISFFLLIFFSEQWIVSTVVYIPFMVTFMWRAGQIMAGDAGRGELVARCLFCALVYCASAINLERMRKQSFLGRLAGQKSFHRWLKVFDTFPEGFALVRGGDLVYSNHALPKLMEINNYQFEKDPFFDCLKKNLQKIKITKLGKDLSSKEQVFWDFLNGNESGAAFSFQYQMSS